MTAMCTSRLPAPRAPIALLASWSENLGGKSHAHRVRPFFLTVGLFTLGLFVAPVPIARAATPPHACSPGRWALGHGRMDRFVDYHQRVCVRANPASGLIYIARADVAPHYTGPTPTSAAPLRLPAYVPAGSSAPASVDTGGVLGLIGKFAIVLGLLLVCLRVLRAVMPHLQGTGGAREGASGGMVLHSERLGDKERVLLLDLGTRIVFVGASSAGMNPLATVDDPDEAAALRDRYTVKPTVSVRGRIAAASSGPSFAADFARALVANTPGAARHAARPASDGIARDASLAGPGGGDPALAGSIERMRLLRQRMEEGGR